MRWRGASDAWLEKWWPRFADQITEALASSYHREKVPVTDEEGLAVASGPEVRGAVLLPPTLAGWQRFLELAPPTDKLAPGAKTSLAVTVKDAAGKPVLGK